MQYRLLLDYNSDVPESVENKYLQKVYELFEKVSDGREHVDDDGIDGNELLGFARLDCVEVFWLFLKERSDHIAQANRSTCEDVDDGKTPVVRMQVKTVDGSLEGFEHDELLKLHPDPTESPFPDLMIFQRTQVHRIDDIAREIFKVMIDGKEYCLKTLYSTTDEDIFLKELTVLRNIPHHANVIALCGAVATEGGRIEGLLTLYINGMPLRCMRSASEDQRSLWKREITDAVL